MKHICHSLARSSCSRTGPSSPRDVHGTSHFPIQQTRPVPLVSTQCTTPSAKSFADLQFILARCISVFVQVRSKNRSAVAGPSALLPSSVSDQCIWTAKRWTKTPWRGQNKNSSVAVQEQCVVDQTICPTLFFWLMPLCTCVSWHIRIVS
jgi:hypothetical protein